MSRIGILDPTQKGVLQQRIAPYLDFRQRVNRFLSVHFGEHCTQNCFSNHLSACCSKDGIVTFWADGVINALTASAARMEDLFQALQKPHHPGKCTYLGPTGCRWQVRPLMCAMFLCDPVQARVFDGHKDTEADWEALQREAKGYRWPDRPVLFDWLETYFLDLGCHSPLMYINHSPGLLRIKRQGLAGAR